MADDPHSRGGPPTFVQAGARTPSHAERARTLVAGRDDGALSTIALDPAGFPFGSVVTFATDDDGAPLLLMSTLAEHARNLAADPRASLLVTAGGHGAGRLAAARATLIGRVAAAPGEGPLAAYLAAHPGAFWARFPDFGVHRLTIEAIRYVRGFGEMSWVDARAYAAAEPDPLAAAESGIIAHMNDDHRDAMRAMATALLDLPAAVADAELLAVDRYGIELRLTLVGRADGQEVAFGRIGFDAPLTAADQARKAMVALIRRARGSHPPAG